MTALAAEAIATVRRERRPIVLEFFTTRVRGHYEGDSQRYRNDPSAPVDPVAITRDLLAERGIEEAELGALDEAVRAEVAAAVEAAKASPEPTLESAAAEVYA